jgi:hypothetical protein
MTTALRTLKIVTPWRERWLLRDAGDRRSQNTGRRRRGVRPGGHAGARGIILRDVQVGDEAPCPATEVFARTGGTVQRIRVVPA